MQATNHYTLSSITFSKITPEKIEEITFLADSVCESVKKSKDASVRVYSRELTVYNTTLEINVRNKKFNSLDVRNWLTPIIGLIELIEEYTQYKTVRAKAKKVLATLYSLCHINTSLSPVII